MACTVINAAKNVRFEKVLRSLYYALIHSHQSHSFGHFEKCVLFNSRDFLNTSRLKSAGSEKRGV
jgi:hypothetical protein